MNNLIKPLFSAFILFVAMPICAEPLPQTTPSLTLIESLYQKVDQRDFDAELFKQALASSKVETQVIALKGLGRIGGKQIIPLVIPFLKNENHLVRHAAVFALGISQSTDANQYLWPLLKSENNETIRQEIYLALGNLGSDHLVVKMLNNLNLEKDLSTKASIFQSLSMAMTMHPELNVQLDMTNSQSDIDFNALLALMEQDDQLSYAVGYFLARVKKIEKQLSPAQLQRFILGLKDTNNKKIFARLIGKVTKKKHLANRRLLTWLIEQTEQKDISLATEAIHAMKPLLYIPQAKIQLGKLIKFPNQLVAQTALKVLADSNIKSGELIKLFKEQLKSENVGMVVIAMSGLIDRQKRDKMTWALKILSHKSNYVKIRFAQMIASKDKKGFTNVLKSLSKDTAPSVASFVNDLLEEKETKTVKQPTSSYQAVLDSNDQIVILKTSKGDVHIQLNNHAPYTAAHFIQLVKNGIYDGSYFARVIGNFVAQGGDTTENNYQYDAKSIREEISYLSHLTGTVGIATGGKDTGTTGFFINLGDNIHLDRRYTIFGNVIKGMENVYKLSNGDQIISAKLAAQ